jgi:hypothetical protein
MHPMKFVARALLFTVDCIVILLALAFIIVTMLVSGIGKLVEVIELRSVYRGDVKARDRDRWQHGT